MQNDNTKFYAVKDQHGDYPGWLSPAEIHERLGVKPFVQTSLSMQPAAIDRSAVGAGQ